MKQIDLNEYEPHYLSRKIIPSAAGIRLWRDYGDKIAIEFPGPKTDDQWCLTALGWAGHIPLTPDFWLRLHPKVPLHNLFRMWEYAYTLHGFHWLDGVADAGSLLAFYERLAHVLALRVLDRGQRGLNRAYLSYAGRLAFVRGQLQLRNAWQKPGQTALTCRYEEHTADIPDNQILAYTLGMIARSRRCREPVQRAVRRAYHVLQSVTSTHSFTPQDCIGRSYTRLNQDYRPLHALCRFFLEYTGPTHASGDHQMLPFLVNMARLYEQFVAEWLKAHLPAPWRIKAQERVTVGAQDELQFDIDLVLYDEYGRSHAVLETKYKTNNKPGNDDISQIVTYAQAKGCHQAILIYPAPLAQPLDVQIGDVHLRTLTFALDIDLEEAGQQFLTDFLWAERVKGVKG